MDTNAILKRADELFDDDRAPEAGAYLEKMAEQAISEERYGTAMSLFNELTGYYRNTGNLDAAWRCVDEIVRLLDLLDLWGTADAATAMLNIASVYKAAGDPAAALAIYKKCEPVFMSENVGDRRFLSARPCNIKMHHAELHRKYNKKGNHHIQQCGCRPLSTL